MSEEMGIWETVGVLMLASIAPMAGWLVGWYYAELKRKWWDS